MKTSSLLYTDNEHIEKEIRKTIQFTRALKRIKYLSITITKEVKDPLSKNTEKRI
jgi:hypothetical protein